jgi:hypothetical protein
MPGPNHDTSYFFRDIPAFATFPEVTNPHAYRPLPPDWWIVVADVAGSTQAIEAGHYKEVNVIGVAIIAAIRKLAQNIEIPFVFGGDGASLCIPPQLYRGVWGILLATQRLAQQQYHLHLRVGMIEASRVTAAGYEVRIAKYQLSSHCQLAVFSGGGLVFAEDSIKKNPPEPPSMLSGEAADYSMLECRWQSIPSPQPEVVAILVRVNGEAGSHPPAQIYREVLAEIARIYGDMATCHPVNAASLRLNTRPSRLSAEVKLKTFGSHRWTCRLYSVWIALQTWLGQRLIKNGVRLHGIDWGQYGHEVVHNCDFHKFDDMLRLIIAGSPEQRQQLNDYLNQRWQAGELVYGLHAATESIMTCLIENRQGRHFHFIDGADGGYTLAAKELKRRQIDRLSRNEAGQVGEAPHAMA